jgi:RNA polymerase sigma factor (sigma-70 family)
MTSGTRNGVIDRLRRVADRAGGPVPSDGELLAHFVASRDEEAFAALVRRHGPLVLAVCRRVTADAEVADDAFQAVFLVLAMKADTVRPREAVRGWLYGVATRTALRARTMTGRREKRETPVAAVPDRPAPPEHDTDPDALRILDEEVARLPDSLRAAVVLCELDGVGRKAAAARLRVPEGTLSSRLAKARKLLAKRLRARGVVMPAAGFAALVGSSAALSGEQIRVTAQAALGSTTPSAVAADLSREVVRTMFLSKLKYVSGLLAGLVVAAAALALNPSAPVAAAPPSPSRTPVVMPVTRPALAPAPVPAPREPVLMLWGDGAPVFLTPDGKVTDRPNPPDWHGNKWGGTTLTLGRLSPDGKRVLFSEVSAGANGGALEFRHAVRPVVGNEKPAEVVKEVRGPYSFWSRDGRRVYGAGYDPEKQDKRDPKQLGLYEMENWVVDLASGKKSAVPVPNTCAIRDESPDGRHFLTVEFGPEKDPDGKVRNRSRAFVTTPGAKPDHRPLAPYLGDLIGLSFSPDGSKVLALRPIPADVIGYFELLSIDVKTEKAVRLNLVPDEQGMYSACWSPDGKKVAYVWWESAAAPPVGAPGAPAPPPAAGPGAAAAAFIGSHVMIVDADGKNRKRVHTEEGGRVRAIDWR